MSEPLKWTEVGEQEFEARTGRRHYVVKRRLGSSDGCHHWMVSGWVRPNPDIDVEEKLGDPVLRSCLDEAKQQAQWWESEQELWQST